MTWRMPWKLSDIPFFKVRPVWHAEPTALGCFSSCLSDYQCVLPPIRSTQLAAIIREGARPEVPPRDELPGPDTDWGGLDDYVSLMQ